MVAPLVVEANAVEAVVDVGDDDRRVALRGRPVPLRAAADRAHEGDTPAQQLHARSFWTISPKVSFDAAFYYVGELSKRSTPSYTRTDVRLGWRPIPMLDLGAGVRNLFDDKHLEYQSGSDTEDTFEVERSLFGEMTWCF